MKKTSLERKRYYIRRCIRNRDAQLRSAGLQKQRRQTKYRKNQSKLAVKTVRVSAPEQFVLSPEGNRAELIVFIERIKECLGRGQKIQIRFAKTKKLLPNGTLYFIASIESLIALYPGRITCDYPTEEVVEQLFQHIGLLQKLGLAARKAITAEEVKDWHFLHGVIADPSGFKELFAKFAAEMGSEETKAGLYESMTEAITNAVQHAYHGISTIDLRTEPRWWMFAQKKGSTLDVAIGDLGIGIPKSLSEKTELSEILPSIVRRLRKRTHSGLIEIAVESSRSRTRLPHRGKGLPDMLTFSKQCNVGGFLIHSSKGSFTYTATAKRESTQDHRLGIRGTIIHWQLDLAA
jgi:hypothetical protein